jgi:hypothetical protein
LIPRVANWPPKFMDTEYQKGHIGSNFSLDLRIVLLGSSFNLRMYFKMYSIHCMQIMEKHLQDQVLYTLTRVVFKVRFFFAIWFGLKILF